MPIFHVPLQKQVDDSYDIEIAKNLFEHLISDLKNNLVKGIDKYALITDSNVKKLYGTKLLDLLTTNGFNTRLFSFPAGEQSKTRVIKAQLEDEMIAAHFGRDSCVIALGGGVVTDLAGFLAGTFARGIPFINYATTLLAAADASIGGKTAVNTDIAANLIGLFYQPKKVYIDIQTWNTLSFAEIKCGLAETIKHACMADYNFFKYLEKNIEKIVKSVTKGKSLPEVICKHIARKNCEIKYNVVKNDELESNLRQILNLGHTVGRALEPLSDYKLLHGEAVAIGLALQTKLGLNYGYISTAESERVIALLKKTGLPVELPLYIKPEALVNKMYTDKKVRRNKIRFVFQKGIGKMMRFRDSAYSRPVADREIMRVLKDLSG